MHYLNQIKTVTLWEYRRFFKPKNELIGIGVMLLVSALSFLITRFAMAEANEKATLTVVNITDSTLKNMLTANFEIVVAAADERDAVMALISEQREGILLEPSGAGFKMHAYRDNRDVDRLRETLNEHSKIEAMSVLGITPAEMDKIHAPASITETYVFTRNVQQRAIMAYVLAGLMVMAVFLGFAYQFTAITGEKQLKITEQIVSAIKPQAWMDGKIFGISLTGLSSILTYSAISVIGGILFFQFTGLPISNILAFLHLPSILLFFPFALTGILLWNAILAAVAAVITDPHNSWKSSLMMLPILFVATSFFVPGNPDSDFSVFISWFPLTSASAMPIRWATSEVSLWHVAGSFALLAAAFYLLRKLAAKIFRVSILISGKEPTWSEIYRLMRVT